MALWGDERGQAIQIGAVMLFAFLVLAFAGYQAVVVPNQNAVVEANHAQLVSDDMVELRSSIVDAWSTGSTRTATVHLGTTYPPRVLAVNPAPPGGTLRTTNVGDIEVRVVNPDGSVMEEVQLCNDLDVETRTLTYTPAYNEYANAPEVVYENSVIYRRFKSDTLFQSDQRVVLGTNISLMALSTEYQRSGRSAVSIDAIGGTRTISFAKVTPGHALNVTFPSQLSATTWNETLLDDQKPPVQHVSKTGDRITLTLGPPPGPPENYTVVCRRIGLDRPP